MRRKVLLLGLLGFVAVFSVSSGSAAGSAVPAWGHAVEVPGTPALNSGGSARVQSISCAKRGECTAGGYYEVGSGHTQAFVVSEKSGRWGKAVEVPGTGTLNSSGSADVLSVSCVTAGNCVAGGSYADGSGEHAFVASEASGRWSDAVEVPGLAALNSGGNASLTTVSCGAVGECAAGGYYPDGSGHHQAFVVTATAGSWGNATEVPGTASLNGGGDARVDQVSCGAAGECAAGGYYRDGSGHDQAFVADEASGSWSDAAELPGSPTLNAGGNAAVTSIACAAAGDCAAGGYYKDGSSHGQAFVASETTGTWGNAVEVPGTAALNSGGAAQVQAVSCAAAGECVAGGKYEDGLGDFQPFVVSETSDTWGDAAEVPGAATLNVNGNAAVNSISCAAVGDCAVGGYYTDASDHFQALVESETSDSWGDAVEVPGTATLNAGGTAFVLSVSCGAPGHCAAGGTYLDGNNHSQAFVVDSPPASPCVVPNVVGKALSVAKTKLKAAHCSVGKITLAYSKVKAGRVAAQHPKARRHLNNGAKVALTVSKGNRK